MELPTRKNIRLPEYDYRQGGAYFVTICAYRRTCRFGDAESAVPSAAGEMLLDRLHAIEAKFPGVTVDASVVMPNHVHVLLFLTDGQRAALPEIVGWFKAQTTNAYIRGVRAGEYPPFDRHIWQRGYYEHVVRNETDLYEIRKYIEENPLKWREDEEYVAP